MSVTFFDIKTNWNKFIPYLTSKFFIQHMKIYKYWHFNLHYDGPLIDIDLAMLDTKIPDTEDVIFVKNKLNENPTITNPYYFCVPHDCIELNPLIMGALISLFYNINYDNIYVITITPIDSYDRHIVISTQKLSIGIMNIVKDNIENSIILYDLIYPLCEFFGNSWVDRSIKLEMVNIQSCSSLTSYIESMAYYFNYYKDYPSELDLWSFLLK